MLMAADRKKRWAAIAVKRNLLPLVRVLTSSISKQGDWT